MDGDLNAVLQSVLSDPEQMGKIASMAQSLMGTGGETAAPAQESAPAAASPQNVQQPLNLTAPQTPQLLSALTGMLGKGGQQTRSTALLSAMRPYMKPEKQEKLDRAMQIARMVRVAGTVMRELGGGDHGI